MDSVPPLIELRQVSKAYPQGSRRIAALERVDLDIDRGAMISVMGPSGSGKSTLLNVLAGIDSPDSGEVLFDGRPMHTLPDDELTLLRRHSIGLVFQFFNLFPTLSAAENVALPLRLARRPAPEIGERVRELLQLVGLGERASHTPDQLSGGEMQRVAIARALALAPRIVLADEPTGNLDSQTGHEILTLLRSTVDRLGTTIVMVTHDPGAARVGDRVVHLRDGRIERDAPPV